MFAACRNAIDPRNPIVRVKNRRGKRADHDNHAARPVVRKVTT